MKEADVQINGEKLSHAEAMALRVAVTQFLITLNDDGLGDDEIGMAICRGYKNACHAILTRMIKT